jgi:nucleoside-diphosphate-sugar epimerase
MPADPILITGGLGFLGSPLSSRLSAAGETVRVLALADLCEKCFVPLGIEPPLHRRRVSFFQDNRAFSIDKVRSVLGFEPRMNLQDSLRGGDRLVPSPGLALIP